MKEQLEEDRIFNTKYDQNEPEFNDVHSRKNLPKIRDGTYVTNHFEFKSIGPHWIDLCVNSNNIIYFDSFFIFQKKLENPLETKIS